MGTGALPVQRNSFNGVQTTASLIQTQCQSVQQLLLNDTFMGEELKQTKLMFSAMLKRCLAARVCPDTSLSLVL